MRYRSHSSKAAISEEITKSQRISQFLEDVNRQLPNTMSSAKSSNPNTHRGGTQSSSGHGPNQGANNNKNMLKYPTYERQATRSLDNEHQVVVVKENNSSNKNRDYSNNLHAVNSFGDTANTSTMSQRTNKSRAFPSPNSNSSVMTIKASATPRLSEKTRNILAKYTEPAPRSNGTNSQSTYQTALKRAIAANTQNNTSALTSNLVSFEEFTQKRPGVSEATQAMIKEVKAKSEKLTSRLRQSNKDANSEPVATEIQSQDVEREVRASKSEENTSAAVQIRPKDDIVLHERKAEKQQQKEAKEVIRDMKEKGAQRSARGYSHNKNDIGGTGDAKAVRNEESARKSKGNSGSNYSF